MNCRAWARLRAKPSRVTTLSSRRSSSDIRASPVLPPCGWPSSKYLRNWLLVDAVVPLDLLLLAQADRVLARLAAAELVHARHALAALDGALGRVAPRPLQEQLQAFPTAKSADRSGIASHGPRFSVTCLGSRIPAYSSNMGVFASGSTRRSDPPLLRGPAAVVRQRGDVLDRLDRQTRGLERGDGALAARARALDLDLDFLDAVLGRGGGGGLGRSLGGERRALAAALEADGPGWRPSTGRRRWGR